MVLNYFLKEKVSPEDLLEEALLIGGHTSSGWTHRSLASIARNHGLYAYPQEFRSKSADLKRKIFQKGRFEEKFFNDGIEKIKNSLIDGEPVIVSIQKNFNKTENSTHLIPLIGLEIFNNKLKGFYYHEPNCADRESAVARFVELALFDEGWRRMAIFVSRTP